MDCTRRSRAENALEKQNLRKSDLKEDEAHARRCEAESWKLGHGHWPSALGTSRSPSRFSNSQPENVGLLVRPGVLSSFPRTGVAGPLFVATATVQNRFLINQ
jgi:hypothetical protein